MKATRRFRAIWAAVVLIGSVIVLVVAALAFYQLGNVSGLLPE